MLIPDPASSFTTSADNTAPPPDPVPDSHILVVDDDAILRRTMMRVLEYPGRRFVEAASVGEARGLLDARPYDLIVLDYRLPDATGLELLDWLRARQRDEAVVMITGEDGIDAAIGALRGGADDFVRKPYHVGQFQRTVQNALHKSALTRANRVMSERLRASEQLHRYLVERSPDLIFTLDAEGRVRFANPRADELLDVMRDGFVGKLLAEAVHPEDRPTLDALLQQAGKAGDEAVEAELRLRRADGGLSVSVSILPMRLRDEHGTPRLGGYHGIMRDLSERKRAEELLAFQAYHDPLTRLPNRLLLKDRLELALAQAERRGTPLALMYLDLDRFKRVNDTYGHEEGDALLRSIAGRLSAILRQGDTLARLGADEFIVLLPDITEARDAEQVALKLLDAMRVPFPRERGGELRISASVGIALFPRDATLADVMLQNADLAMQRAKRAGKDGLRFFDPSLNQHHRGRLDLESELRRAVVDQQLELYYQPQVCLTERRVAGVEALLRWHHPRHGLLAPTRFIALAEESGLILELSAWVLDQALAQQAAWASQGLDVRMSLNLSARDFEHADLPGRVGERVAAHGVRPARVEVEITESLMMQDADGAQSRIAALRELGVGVSIDDFGTGYSSLAYLQRFPVSGLKIDRSFVRDLRTGGANPIVSAITGIARGFGLHVVAEGVELPEQAQLLHRLGCDLMQGYHFAQPLPAPALEALLRDPGRLPL